MSRATYSRSTASSIGEAFVRTSQASRGTLTEPLMTEQAGADEPLDEARAEPPDLWSWPYAALYAHYACIGVVNGLLTQALLPYCLYVSKSPPNTCATVSTFVNLPWGFKLLYGLISDCVPICGQHRKPYMVLGWALTFGGALAMAMLPSISLELASGIFLGMTIAYLFADCAADAALVGFSALEPAESRGSILSTAYSIRFTFNILAAGVVSFLYNGPPSGGDFAFGLTTQQLMWIVVVLVGLLMGTTLPLYREDRRPPGERVAPLCERLGVLYRLLQQPAVWRLIVALTTTTALSLVTNQAQTNSNAQWFRIQPLQLGLSACFQSLILALGTAAYKKFLLNASWRATYGAGIVGMQVFNLLYLLTVYFDFFKNGWWYVFTQVDMEFAYAFTFVIGIIIVPEITLPGYEGVIYGAITTYSNQAQNITNAINNVLLALWPTNADNADLRLCALGSPPPPPGATLTCADVQWNMTKLTVLCVCISTTSLLCLPLLPSQKGHVHELAQLPRSKRAGKLMLALLLVLTLVGTGFAVLPILPATACLRIAGGRGCPASPGSTALGTNSSAAFWF